MDINFVMMDTETDYMNQTETYTPNGLGLRLRRAREAMSLTTKDAAAHLHLSVNIIDIIEKEQFADGPPPTFMRGYLRSYARFLNVPEHEISKTLKDLEITMPIKNTPVPIMQTRSIDRSARYVHWITYLIVLTMLVLVGSWWHSHQTYIISDVPPKATTPISAPPVLAAPAKSETAVTPQPAENTTITSAPAGIEPAKSEAAVVSQPAENTIITPTTSTPAGIEPTPTETPATTTETPLANSLSTKTPAATEGSAPATAPSLVAPTPTTVIPEQATPPQVDTPPIVSATTAPLELNQTPSLATQPTAPVKHNHKARPARRNATLPGMPGVNMALPEPN